MKKVFNKEKWIREIDPYFWMNDFNGKEVVNGKCGDMCIKDSWCDIDYESGDYVKLKDRRGENWNNCGKMDKYIGAVVRIREINSNHFFIFNDDRGVGTKWHFDINDIDRPATKEEFNLYRNKTSTADREYKITIVVPKGDKTVTATYVEDGKVAKRSCFAKCHEDDNFDFATGARLAFDRLLKELKD